MFVYLVLEIFVIFVPLFFSYDRKLKFYLKLKSVAISMLCVGSFYIAGDILFTQHAIWGFNPKYHTGIMLLNLPVEEWLFFIVIPYASLFLHDTLVYLFPDARLSARQTKIVSIPLVTSLGLIVFFNFQRTYTSSCFTLVIFAILLAKREVLSRFYLTFIIILVPFFLVNSVLTGSFISEPVVWYNNAETLGIRLFTVPVEDISYAFSLILYNLLLINKLEDIFARRPVKGNSFRL